MSDSLKISSSKPPFFMYLAGTGGLGFFIASEQYIPAFFLLLLFVCFLGWKQSIEFFDGEDSAVHKTLFFGLEIRKRKFSLSKFKMVRNRIQFNGTKISGNTCVTEFVDKMGRVLKVRDENIGFSKKESISARRYLKHISELTSVPMGELLIENP